MPYILNKTNGTQLAVVDDASLDTTTSLIFVGKNYAGYGETVNENFIRLLENFSNPTAPVKPLSGQLWFNSSTKKINVYTGTVFKAISNLRAQSTVPPALESSDGDFWWDTSDTVNKKLKIFDGSAYQLIGPLGSTKSAWQSIEESAPAFASSIPVLAGTIAQITQVAISSSEFDTQTGSVLNSAGIYKVKRGITMYGADPVTGSSKDAGYYFWGTAAESLVSSATTGVAATSTSTNAAHYVTFVSTSTGEAQTLQTNTGFSYNPSSNTLTASIFDGVATSARFADLAERYEADVLDYQPGTVVVFGGSKEITVTDHRADTRVAGIISQDPAYMMNSAAGTDQTHPYVALRGRVFCKVSGPINKGDLLVSSAITGYAEAWKPGDDPNAVIAKAIFEFRGLLGIVEVLV